MPDKLVVSPTERQSPHEAQSANGNPQQSDHDARFAQLVALCGLLPADVLHDAGANASGESLAATLVNRGLITERDRSALEHLASSRKPDQGNRDEFSPSATLTYNGPAGKNRYAPDNALPKCHAVIGDYELIEQIGRGGMGVVYKARQRSLNRLVAVKLIRSVDTVDAAEVRRFMAEARTAGGLDHPGIVQVYDFGEAEGQHFFSMALVEGHSLSTIVRRDSPFPPREAARLLQEVAAAVHFAHCQGVIHRDIKPHNILLDASGRPRVADFGLARQGGGEFTIDGQVLGTPSYMSPEQAAGRHREVGPVSDVYGLGATLYFLLIGRPPFQAASTIETIRQVVECQPARLRHLNASIPSDLETICLKCLEKEPHRRYATAEDLAHDLTSWLEGKPIRARPTSVARHGWLWAKRNRLASATIVATMVVVLTAALTVWHQRVRSSARMAALKLENDRAIAKSYVDGALNSPAAGFPYALQLLQQLPAESRPLLRESLVSSSLPRQRQHAAMALSSLEEPQTEFLISAISSADADECGNFVAALALDPQHALKLLQDQAGRLGEREAAFKDLSRGAILALYLGDSSIAERLCRRQPNPASQIVFVETLAKWHGDLSTLATIVKKCTDPALRSAICLAAGNISADRWASNEIVEWRSLCHALHRQSPDRELHSASGWALQQWGETLDTDVLKSIEGGEWRITPAGLTMIKIPAGSFVRTITGPTGPAQQVVTISRPFFMADRETSQALFQAFVDDHNWPADEKPSEWRSLSADSGMSDDAPVRLVHWQDVAQFCNWLNAREGYPPSFQRKEGNLIASPAAKGYRLPTEAEWELACRGGIDGDLLSYDETRLGAYAVFHASDVARRGSRLPNRYGLLDVCGNVSELCADFWAQQLPEAVALTDPTGPKQGNAHTLRGGCYRNGVQGMRLSSRSFLHPTARSEDAGFRLVRTASDD